MAINKITAKSIKDAEIVAADIAPGTITDAKIATGTITNAKLAGSIANAKLSNSAITINGTAISLGASGEIVAGTDWQAVTVADGSTTLTAEAGKGYFLDTNAGVIEVFLPTSPSRGDTVVLVDYAGHFALNNAIVNTGTNNLDSTTTRQYKLATNDSVVELVYVDSAKGWITKILQAAGTTPDGVFTSGLYDTDSEFISATGGTINTSGNFKVHTFTGDGNFVVSAGSGPLSVVDYLVVAGGGGGGGSNQSDSGGGGGGGGFRSANSYGLPGPATSPLANPTGLSITPATYPITVGGGGAGGQRPGTIGSDGSNSVFSTITSAGGGGGATGCCGPNKVGRNGGSGGGGGNGSTAVGGTGNTPPVSPPQGSNGGDGSEVNNPTNYYGGGGGGAGAVGTDANVNTNGVGGIGSFMSTSLAVGCVGSPGPVSGTRYFSGGGGAGAIGNRPGTATSTGGSGGGGGPNQAGGPANTGGGGGAAATNGQTGGAGAKGIVLIRYKFQ